MTHPRSPYPRFIKCLEDLVPRDPPEGKTSEGGDRAALAALRRGLGKRPGEVSAMYPYVIPLLSVDRAPGWEWRDDSYYIVASLFALYPTIQRKAADERDNLGAAMRALARAIQQERNPHGDENGDKSVERRFVALLNATTIDLPEHLRHAVSLIRSNKGAPININWVQLLYDVQDWDVAHHPVQQRWACAFWTPSSTEGKGSGADDAGNSGDVGMDTQTSDDL